MASFWTTHYEKGVPAEIDSSVYQSIPELLSQSFKKFSDRPAFHNMGETLSYSEVDRLSLDFGSYLQNELGLKRGDRVAIMMPNLLQYPIALFGALRAGMVVVNVNPLYTPRELAHQLKDSGAKTIVILANFAHVLQKSIEGTDIQNIIVTELGDLLGQPKKTIVNAVVKYVKKMVPHYHLSGSIKFAQALKRGSYTKLAQPKLNHEDIAFLQYTGGTTGVSKGAILTHGNIVSNMVQARAWIVNRLQEGQEIIVTALPLYHIFSLTANCFVFSSMGAMNLLITNPKDLNAFINELKKWKFTAFTGVNTLFNALLHHSEFSKIDFSALKLTLGGGMAVQKSVAEKWKELTRVPLIEAYGLTETSPAACMNPMNLPEYNGYVGLPISSTEVKIFDDNGKELEIGQVGEVCIRGPQVMKGYWNRPDETAKVLMNNGFLKTGDLGFMDQKGFVKLVDRKKDMILVSGFNVYPNEIEDVVATHPKVLEAAAVGIPDEKSGEVVKLFVVKKESSLTEDELISFCKENMTGYKVPKKIEFRKELPKSNVGKILRKELRPQV